MVIYVHNQYFSTIVGRHLLPSGWIHITWTPVTHLSDHPHVLSLTSDSCASQFSSSFFCIQYTEMQYPVILVQRSLAWKVSIRVGGKNSMVDLLLLYRTSLQTSIGIARGALKANNPQESKIVPYFLIFHPEPRWGSLQQPFTPQKCPIWDKFLSGASKTNPGYACADQWPLGRVTSNLKNVPWSFRAHLLISCTVFRCRFAGCLLPLEISKITGNFLECCASCCKNFMVEQYFHYCRYGCSC